MGLFNFLESKEDLDDAAFMKKHGMSKKNWLSVQQIQQKNEASDLNVESSIEDTDGSESDDENKYLPDGTPILPE